MLRGLSGGERRRLSIAVGTLAAPAVLFLDEPTSGLDSFAALSVMSHLQGMARDSGRIIISTIHQPRTAIWEMFDRVRSCRHAWGAGASGWQMYTVRKLACDG
jgi:ABC-type multidrug transport system ATPase subunit